ncbi:ABC transporter permease [Pimelobacter simplex]|uniref:ABC transporter permease n=1 Tax=Nocardioides simplex TaxID=2045 RepID=UPI003AAA5C6F
MNFWTDGFGQAWDLVLGREPWLLDLTLTTLKVALLPTLVAFVVGLPIGLALGLGRFRGRGVGLVLANAGLGLPPVIVGLFLVLLMFPVGPLGRLHLLFTLNGVYVAQTVLALPIIVALSASAVRDVSPGLLDQARAFGAGRLRVGALATREARTGILAAVIAAIGSGLSEVGAVVLVGGNIDGLTQTLASATLARVNAAHWAEAIAIGIVLLGLILVVVALLTMLQYGRRRPGPPRRAT